MPGDHDCSNTTANYSREEWLGGVTELWNDYISLFSLTRKGQEQTSFLHFFNDPFNFMVKGGGEEISISYLYHFPVPKLQQSMSSIMPDWSRGMYICMGRRCLRCGHSNLSQQAAQNSSGSSLQLILFSGIYERDHWRIQVFPTDLSSDTKAITQGKRIFCSL